MTLFANQSREAMRRAYLEAWQKFTAQQPLTELQKQLAAVIAEHRQYHAWLAQDETALSQEFTPEEGQQNPFLHLGMHLALREQVTTNRPAGIAAIHTKLTHRHGGAHDAEHRMMNALGTAMWEAQRLARAPDEASYLEALQRLT